MATYSGAAVTGPRPNIEPNRAETDGSTDPTAPDAPAPPTTVTAGAPSPETRDPANGSPPGPPVGTGPATTAGAPPTAGPDAPAPTAPALHAATDDAPRGDRASQRAALMTRFRTRGSGAVRGQRHLLTGSSVLVVGAAVQGVGGMVFSLIVAQWDSKADFGNASALFTSVLFVTYLAGLGLPVALARYAADRSIASHVVFAWAVVATTVASVVTAGLYLGLVNPAAAEVLWDWHPVGGFALFALVVMGSAFSLIFDVRCMTMRRWNLVLGRIVLVGVAKIALLPIGQDLVHRPLLLFLYLGGPVAVSGFVGVGLLRRITGDRHRLRPRPASARAAVRYSGINYLSTLAYQAPYFALPVIVLVNVDSVTNSSFYVAWGIVAIAFYVPSAIGQALLAEGGKDGAHFRSQMRLAMALAIGLMAGGALVTWLGQGVVVAAYGEDYRDSAEILPAMMLAGIPWALSSLYLTEARVMHRHVSTVIITITLTLAIIVPALVLVPGDGRRSGLDGAATAWLAGNVFAAVVAVVVTVIARRASTRRAGPVEADPMVPVA
jgi:O-antigen/teichoic acid export membrane protein